MKIKVDYTTQVSNTERISLACLFGNWLSREDIQAVLITDGTKGLAEHSDVYLGYTVEEWREFGVPERTISFFKHRARKA